MYHIPNPILALIVSHVSQEGVAALKSWIHAGREDVMAALSPETLSRVRLDKNPFFVWMSKPPSAHYAFYCKCLKEGNPSALYVESLRQVFVLLDLKSAISILYGIKDVFPLAELLFIMLNSCAGVQTDDVYIKFRKQYCHLTQVQQMADALLFHIHGMKPRRYGTFLSTWRFDDIPDCWQEHEWLREFNGERCIYYCLSRDICLLS